MSEYSETLDTQGAYRVRLILDQYADEPYDDGASPLLRIEASRRWGRYTAEHVMASGRPLGDDARIEEAAARWGDRPELLDKYLRAYYGVTQVTRWSSQDYEYVTYDPKAWRDHVGAPAGSANLDEYRAYVEGDVWGYVVEKSVAWHAHTDDPAFEDRDTEEWEDVDSCFGYYGREYAEESAREALADAVTPVTTA